MSVIQRGKRARWPGAAHAPDRPPGGRSRGAELPSNPERETTLRWLENRDAGGAISGFRRLARVVWDRCNQWDAPIYLPWSRAGRGSTALARLHRILAAKKRSTGGHEARRLWCWVNAAVWPLLATTAIGFLLVRCGRRVREHYGLSLFAQARALVRLAWRGGVFPTEYYHHRIFRTSSERDLESYLPEAGQRALLQACVRGMDTSRVNTSAGLARECRVATLPVVRTVATFGLDREGRPCRPVSELPPRDLLLRPESWTSSVPGELWRWNAQSHGWMHRGQRATAPELRERAIRRAGAQSWLLQEAVSNHPDIARFSAGGVCVARLATAITADHEPRVLFAALHLPASVDAGWGPAPGELIAGIDVGSGRLGVAMDEFASGGEFTVHPGTGVMIEDAIVPQWRAIQDLACRAHRHFADLPFVGWRIALSGGGPIVLDANTDWGVFRHVWPGETIFADLCLRRLAGDEAGGATGLPVPA